MPDRAVIEAATPRCPTPRYLLQQATARDASTCARLLRYHHATLTWECAEHGRTLSAEALVQRQQPERNSHA